MAWKQDLAKLKQQLGPEPALPAPKALPKPVPKPQGPASMDDEDAVFLSAMGLKSAAPRPPQTAAAPSPAPSAAPAQPLPPPPPPETFEEALKDLKGLKPLARGPKATSAPATTPPPRPAPAPPAAPLPEAAPPPPEASVPEAVPLSPPPPGPPVAPVSAPLRFQLAAGMAIDVDGVLDLRGHTLQDAVERLKDRLGDGQVLGWRSLQVILGPDPLLHEGLMALLASGETPMVARYAQAPVPMGGSQAWLLYFVPSQPQS
ncbi:Smr/MutS family protein [Geothrix oryzisoli]|uniref:Smr/MutS family protein n=1 Tax=Geothrix oryzisoli TaxID=2922721 RepID=UPI001FAC109F|nr:Smr/MutS family protein [Geothrix oryzisoli]